MTSSTQNKWSSSNSTSVTSSATSWSDFVTDKLRELNCGMASSIFPPTVVDPFASLFRTTTAHVSSQTMPMQYHQQQQQEQPSLDNSLSSTSTLSRMSSISSISNASFSIPGHYPPPLPMSVSPSSFSAQPAQPQPLHHGIPRLSMCKNTYLGHGRFPSTLRPLAPKAFIAPYHHNRYALNPIASSIR